MKFVESIDSTSKAEELTAEQREDVFTRLVLGKDITEEVDTSRGRFVVKYPKPKDFLAIGRIAAYRRDYKPVGAFDGQTEMFNIMSATLDVVVVSGPAWFEKAKNTRKDFTILEVPSRTFLTELYGKAHSFRDKVDEIIDSETGTAGERVPPAEGADDAVDGGAFGGLSSE